jgi:hypothetical protein
MFNITKLLGLNVCCYRKFIKNRCINLITLVNIGILYNFGLTIYNYSYNIGYNCTNSILYMDENIFAEAILEAFHLAFLVIAICFWIAISDLFLELLDCKKKHKN